MNWRLIAMPFAAVFCSWSAAQGLQDPTRPPTAVTPSGDIDATSGMPPAPKLQSVILRQGARPRALINGEWLEQGQEYAGSKVLRITANAVEMSGPQGREVLRLTPEVELRATQPAAGGKGRTAKRTGKQE